LVIYWQFCIFSSILVYCVKKNLATLCRTHLRLVFSLCDGRSFCFKCFKSGLIWQIHLLHK
jgi:hypothetical protein